MLFAETGMEWLGPIVTAIMAAVAALFAYLTTRDKLRFDAEMASLRWKNETLTARVGAVEDEATRAATEAKRCHEDRDAMEDGFMALREFVASKHPDYPLPHWDRRRRDDPHYRGPERRGGTDLQTPPDLIRPE